MGARKAVILLLLGLASEAKGQEKLPEFKVMPGQNEAIAVAYADVQRIPEHYRRYIRYVWARDGHVDTWRTTVFVLNAISQAGVLYRPEPLGNDDGLVILRVDLTKLVQDPQDPKQIQAIIDVWEDLQNDPRFNLLITGKMLETIINDAPQTKLRGFVQRRSGKKAKQAEAPAEAAPAKPAANPEGYKWYNSKEGSKFKVLVKRDGTAAKAIVGQWWEETKQYRPWDGEQFGQPTTPPWPFPEAKPVQAQPKTKTVRGYPKFEDITIVELDVKDVLLLRIPAQFLDVQQYNELADQCRSHAAIVSHDYLTARALASIEDKGLYAELYGGRYYQFSGIRKANQAEKDKGVTDEDILFDQIGVGAIEFGVTAAKVYDRLKSDQRAALFQSKVTGNPRRVDFLRQLSGRFTDSTGIVSITHDLKRQDIDVDTDPIMNLKDFKDAAREVIWEKTNGLHGYALFDGNGALQEEAPPDVAPDHTIPEPYHRRLQSGISCISCHEAEGSDGWKKVVNEVQIMLGTTKQDLFPDLLGQQKKSRATDNARIAGLYTGDPELKAFVRGRDDYAAAVLRCVGPWKDDKGKVKPLKDSVRLTATKTVDIWRNYFYRMLDAHAALEEIGIQCDPKDAKELFNKLVQPELKAAVDVPELCDIFIPEDPRVIGLKAGLRINRFQWDLVSPFVKERVVRSLKQLKKAG